jgi:predicted RNA-binding Zn-ribbon protein involved in translation (DUF1610 family)
MSMSIDKNTVRICPKCGSTQITMVPDMLLGITPTLFKCDNCGYGAQTFPFVEQKDISNFKKHIKR